MRDGQVVKGLRFRDHRVAGDILELAGRYRDDGADELVFYDITASPEGRMLDRAWIRSVAERLDIPFCVAGGIRSVADAESVLASGAEKVSVNSPALERPELIDELARRFGSQCVVIGIDSRGPTGSWRVHQYAGDPARTRDTGRDTLDWLVEVQERGAGEVVLNCMDQDGVRERLRHPAARNRPRALRGAARRVRRRRCTGRLRGRVPARRRRCGARRGRFPRRINRHPGAEAAPARPRDCGAAVTELDADRLDWAKGGGLLPAIVQDAATGSVLMLGYMNREAFEATQRTGRVTFFSRSRGALWVKGETSGNRLDTISIGPDCDGDAILVQARPAGPVCHAGTASCFSASPPSQAARLGFLAALESVVASRIADPATASYTARLVAEGPRRLAQKVGEEGVEFALAAAGGNDSEVIAEGADLLFHLVVALKARGLGLTALAAELERRHAARLDGGDAHAAILTPMLNKAPISAYWWRHS